MSVCWLERRQCEAPLQKNPPLYCIHTCTLFYISTLATIGVEAALPPFCSLDPRSSILSIRTRYYYVYVQLHAAVTRFARLCPLCVCCRVPPIPFPLRVFVCPHRLATSISVQATRCVCSFCLLASMLVPPASLLFRLRFLEAPDFMFALGNRLFVLVNVLQKCLDRLHLSFRAAGCTALRQRAHRAPLSSFDSRPTPYERRLVLTPRPKPIPLSSKSKYNDAPSVQSILDPLSSIIDSRDLNHMI